MNRKVWVVKKEPIPSLPAEIVNIIALHSQPYIAKVLSILFVDVNYDNFLLNLLTKNKRFVDNFSDHVDGFINEKSPVIENYDITVEEFLVLLPYLDSKKSVTPYLCFLAKTKQVPLTESFALDIFTSQYSTSLEYVKYFLSVIPESKLIRLYRSMFPHQIPEAIRTLYYSIRHHISGINDTCYIAKILRVIEILTTANKTQLHECNIRLLKLLSVSCYLLLQKMNTKVYEKIQKLLFKTIVFSIQSGSVTSCSHSLIIAVTTLSPKLLESLEQKYYEIVTDIRSHNIAKLLNSPE